MRQQYRGTGRNKVQLNIVPQFLIVPPELQFTAEILLTSAERFKDSDNGSFNPLKGKLTADRRSAPRHRRRHRSRQRDGVHRHGDQLLPGFARPGLHVKVAYRRGTNRSPRSAAFTLDKGQWGIGWDVNLDIGASSSISAVSWARARRKPPRGQRRIGVHSSSGTRSSPSRAFFHHHSLFNTERTRADSGPRVRT
jgi:hypothetical protein